MDQIAYKKGFKYQLVTDYTCHVDIYPVFLISTEYIKLNTIGELTIFEGYAWDGPSGPTIDTKDFMRGSLIHDALYQLIRDQMLSKDDRIKADIELRKICLEDGMSKIRAWYVYQAVRRFASSAADFHNKKEVIFAP